jgi:hypothetical protein
VSATLDYLNAIDGLMPSGNFLAKFLLAHGRTFAIDERTFKGRRMTIKQCFSNATRMVCRDPSLTYVEGFVSVIMPVHHAWVMRPDGGIIDPTLRIKGRVGPPPHDYFGVPFAAEFLSRFLVETGVFGLLDGMSPMSIALMTGEIEPTEFLAALEKAA